MDYPEKKLKLSLTVEYSDEPLDEECGGLYGKKIDLKWLKRYFDCHVNRGEGIYVDLKSIKIEKE